MNYVYHYHLIVPQKDGSCNHITGTFERCEMIRSNTEYADSMRNVFANYRINPEKAVVSSLTLLNPPKP